MITDTRTNDKQIRDDLPDDASAYFDELVPHGVLGYYWWDANQWHYCTLDGPVQSVVGTLSNVLNALYDTVNHIKVCVEDMEDGTFLVTRGCIQLGQLAQIAGSAGWYWSKGLTRRWETGCATKEAALAALLKTNGVEL